MARKPLTRGQRALLKTCGRRPRAIKGGRAAKRSPLDFDPRQLRAGIKVELEHTRSRRLACEIAMDHLEEHGNYYSRLLRAKL